MTGYWAIDHFADMLNIILIFSLVGIISIFIWGLWYSHKKQKERYAKDLYHSQLFSK